jgi:protein-S-isoprenylcysteine O-methyltransferase Ste14
MVLQCCWPARREESSVRLSGQLEVRMAQDKEDAAAVRIFPPAVPLVTVLAGIALDRIWRIDPGFTLPAPGRYWAGGLIVAGALLGLGLWSVVIMRRTGQTENPWKPTTEIVESGPFRLTRNPMYLQMVLICIGLAVMLMNVWILLLTPVCAWVLHRYAILPEEAYLEGKFGETYRAYKRRVRRWI